jgi:hypothetical protein
MIADLQNIVIKRCGTMKIVFITKVSIQPLSVVAVVASAFLKSR